MLRNEARRPWKIDKVIVLPVACTNLKPHNGKSEENDNDSEFDAFAEELNSNCMN